jgi:hypothetical protein
MVLHFYLKKNFQKSTSKTHKDLTRRFVIQSHFAAKHFAFCCKTHCDLLQNATLTAAKRKVKWCKTHANPIKTEFLTLFIGIFHHFKVNSA